MDDAEEALSKTIGVDVAGPVVSASSVGTGESSSIGGGGGGKGGSESSVSVVSSGLKWQKASYDSGNLYDDKE